MADYKAELRLNLLGPPEVRINDMLGVFPTRKTLALLIYLAVEGGQQRREHLASLFWPDASTQRSFASLRNTLGHLQTALKHDLEAGPPPAYLSITNTTLALNPSSFSLDLHIIEQAFALANAQRSTQSSTTNPDLISRLQLAANLYRGEFLLGFSLNDAAAFDYWVTVQREAWRRRVGLIVDLLSELQFSSGDFASSAETAARWIDLDQLNEAAYCRKMHAHFAAGGRGQALATFEQCRLVLKTELGLVPEPDTEALAARIRQQSVVSTPAVPDRSTPAAFLEALFWGRSAQHQMLVKYYEMAADGQAQSVILRGEAGIGKTRLAQEFVRWANQQGASMLYGRTYMSGTRIVYHPLISAFRQVFERGELLTQSFAETWLSPLSVLLPELRDSDSAASSIDETEIKQAPLFEALVQLTLALSEQSPVVLFIDDLQWADHATLDWLLYAVRRFQESGSQILLLFSLRSEALHYSPENERPDLNKWLAEMEHQAEMHNLEVGPLSKADAVRMLDALIMPPVEGFTAWLFDVTQGHPFYMMEVLKDLLERRILIPSRQAEGHWTFAVDPTYQVGKAIQIPSTMQVVIRSRLNRLSPNAFALLCAAAVLEHEFSFEQLCIIAHIDVDLALPALDELLASRLLLELEQLTEASKYAFPNDLLRDVVYTEAGDARRRLFHRRALELLEASRDFPAVLAHHAVAAGLAEEAFRHSLTAGQEALRLAAVDEAKRYLELARRLAEESASADERIQSHIRELYLSLGRAYEINGQMAQAQAVYEELQRLLLK